MLDSESLKNLMDALNKAFASFPADSSKSVPDDGASPKMNKNPFGKGKNVMVVSVSKSEIPKHQIPKIGSKSQTIGSQLLGSEKSGDKKE